MEKNLAYTLQKPRRRRGEFTPVIVFDIDQQWVADLIEVQTIAKENKGNHYILVVVDASGADPGEGLRGLQPPLCSILIFFNSSLKKIRTKLSFTKLFHFHHSPAFADLKR